MILLIRKKIRVIFYSLPRVFTRLIVIALEFMNFKIFRSQSNESEVISQIISENNFKNKKIFFFEFGFGPTEFNCARLSVEGCAGMLADMDSLNTRRAQKVNNKNTKIIEKKLNPLDLLDIVMFDSSNFNIINIDVDGIDYEFMEIALMNFDLDLIVVEFNSSFGDLRIKVPFDLNFNRFINHGFWHGSSLNALVDLAHKNNFCLKNVSESFVNAFFVPSQLTTKTQCRKALDEALSNLDQSVRSRISNTSWKDQFELIKKFPLEFLDNSSIHCSAARL